MRVTTIKAGAHGVEAMVAYYAGLAADQAMAGVRIEWLAGVEIDGDTIRLRDVAIYPWSSSTQTSARER